MHPRRVSILGVGLLGGSIGLAVKSKLTDCKIAGYGHRRPTLQAALDAGAIDEAYDDAASAVREADLVVLCTPVGLFDVILQDISHDLAPEAVVTDVGSTKRSVTRDAERRLTRPGRFVGSHPMAGSEKRGVEWARADLFENALCILTPTARTAPDALAGVEAFWRRLGMRTCRLSPEAHDHHVAQISHLPHALAAALVQGATEESLALAGKGFRDLTRIAGGDGGLWRDILMDNRDNVRASVERLKDQLDAFCQLLEPARSDALRLFLDAAADRRARLIDGGSQRQGPTEPH